MSEVVCLLVQIEGIQVGVEVDGGQVVHPHGTGARVSWPRGDVATWGKRQAATCAQQASGTTHPTVGTKEGRLECFPFLRQASLCSRKDKLFAAQSHVLNVYDSKQPWKRFKKDNQDFYYKLQKNSMAQTTFSEKSNYFSVELFCCTPWICHFHPF